MVYPHCYRTEHSETRTTNSTYGDYYAKAQSTKIRIQSELLRLLQYVDSFRVDLVKDLAEAVAIKSVSGNLKYLNQMKAMTTFTENWLIKLGVKYECFNIGYQVLDGQKAELPPVILGTLGKDPNKLTIAIYGHMDVKEPVLSDWDTDPWKVEELDKRLFGNGVALGKGPMLCWFHAIRGLQVKGVEIPVNVKFIIESMNQCGCTGLEDFLCIRRQDFLYNIDYIVVCESEWLGPKIPCVVYGSVGIVHFTVTVEKKNGDPKEDMKKIFEQVCNDKEQIFIPEFKRFVEQITPDEEKVYESIRDFNIEDYRENLPEHKKKWDQVKLLMSFWRLPSITLGEIEECTCEKNDKSIAKRDFTVKLVPRQIIERSVNLTLNHINNVCKELNLDSNVKCEVISTSRPWFEDFRSPPYVAAARANVQIYKDRPSMIREDRDIKSVKILHRVCDKPVVIFPLGNNSINSGKANENITLRNFFEGIKVQAAYLFQFAHVANTNPK